MRTPTALILALAFAAFGASAQAQNTYISLNFSSGQVVANGVSDYSNGGCRIEDRYDDSHHLYYFAGNSFEFTFDIGHTVSKASLKVKHLSSAKDGQPGITPVGLFVNGKKVASWRQLSAGYSTDSYDIGDQLAKGKNTVRFEYASDGGTTGYWQKQIQVYVWE